jgi:cytochrome b561
MRRRASGKDHHDEPQEFAHWSILQDQMPARNLSVRYGPVAQFLHWAVLALLVVQVTLGLIADELPAGFERLVMMSRHKSLGITILGIAVLRLLWRFIDRPPAPPPMPRWQEVAARVTHWSLYVLLFALPITGWLTSSAANRPVSWWGLVQLPDFVAPDEGRKEFFEEAHELLVNVLYVLVAVHVAAVLKHQFLDRNDLMRRMLPGRR